MAIAVGVRFDLMTDGPSLVNTSEPHENDGQAPSPDVVQSCIQFQPRVPTQFPTSSDPVPTQFRPSSHPVATQSSHPEFRPSSDPVPTQFPPSSDPVPTQFRPSLTQSSDPVPTQFRPSSDPVPTQFRPSSDPVPTQASPKPPHAFPKTPGLISLHMYIQNCGSGSFASILQWFSSGAGTCAGGGAG